MHTRLVLLVVCTLLLSACAMDTPDERAASTPSPFIAEATSALRPATAASTDATSPATPTATAPPEATITNAPVQPTREPQAVATPSGSTGISPNQGGTEYASGCLDGGATSRLEGTRRGAVPSFPGPYEAIPFVRDEGLESVLDAALGDRADSYAYYVKELSTGRGAIHNGDAVFNAASLFKLFVMYEVFHQESLGLIEWSDELVVTPYYDAFALSPRVTEVCQVITVADAMEAMLSVSDNAAAVLLQDLAGSGNINDGIKALGLTESGLFEDGLPVTADDLALLMEAIATGNAVSPEASADMTRLLDHDVFENGLVSGLPAGTVVSRKTGNWSDATNVAGIVYAPSGPYVFVALTSNGYETAIIQALSSATYAHFEGISARNTP